MKEPETQTNYGEYKVLVMDEGKDINSVSFPNRMSYNASRITIGQCCNGLGLCTVDDRYSRTRHVIYNPSTKHYKVLPESPFTKNRYLHHATLVFDPAKSSYYEVVCVCTSTDPLSQIEIYSSQTHSWRDAGDPFLLYAPGMLYRPGVYWNGSVHWIDQISGTLHYWNVDSEQMRKIAMPTPPYPKEEDYRGEIVYFNECRGHIHLMEMRHNGLPHFDIWEMCVDYTGWNVKYYVDLNPLTTVYPGFVRHKHFELYVLFVEETEVSSRLVLRIAKDKVISYDLRNKSFKEMHDVRPNVRKVEGFQYIEILAHV